MSKTIYSICQNPKKKKCKNAACEILTTNPQYCSRKCSSRRGYNKVLAGTASFRQARIYIKDTREYKCSCCGIFEYNGKPLSLQLDHIDGNTKNNNLENLRWLCPNCHSQTDNWGVKNISKEGRKRMLEGGMKGNISANSKRKLGL